MAKHGGRDYLLLRDGVWFYQRRVPADVAELDRRRFVRRSTGQRDRQAAATVAARFNAEAEAHWRAISEAAAAGQGVSGAADRFEAAARLARAMGLAYRPAADLAAGPLVDLVQRLELLEARSAVDAAPVVAAALGGAEKPRLRLSELFEAYERLSGDRLIGKSDDQVRKWRNPRRRAVAHAIGVIGDKPLADLTRDDALDFRAWWIDRVRDDGYDQGSANKDLGLLAVMMRALDEAWRLKLDLPFAGVRVAGEKHNPRVPYAPEFVRARILPPGALGGLNPECRAVVLMVALTGLRPAEVVGLTPPRIVLDAAIPYVEIRPDGRQLKTDNAARDVPLVDQALDVMRDHRGGFPRYHDSPDTLSATANKALGAAGLRPTRGHTVYSLRHTFKDRLIAIQAPERVQDALMGHAVQGVRYGAGPDLAQKADWLARIWA